MDFAVDQRPADVALAWLLRRSPNLLLIPGTSSVAHLRENVAAAELLAVPQTRQFAVAVPRSALGGLEPATALYGTALLGNAEEGLTFHSALVKDKDKGKGQKGREEAARATPAPEREDEGSRALALGEAEMGFASGLYIV